jgi:hypothetical protein
MAGSMETILLWIWTTPEVLGSSDLISSTKWCHMNESFLQDSISKDMIPGTNTLGGPFLNLTQVQCYWLDAENGA